MKKFPLVLVSLAFFSIAHGQTLFTYGSHAVSEDEFLRAYNKNKTSSSEKPLSINDYLDLYIKFKLKVQAAKDIRLDTLPTIKSDIESSKQQLENNFMQDDNEVNALVNEAFQRSQKDLHVQHFYVGINSKMIPVDTLNAVKAINELYEELKKGKTNYEEIVSEVNQKFAPVKGSDLGWVTVFTMSYDYENIVYNLKPGQVSQPYRSKSGWHIFKLEAERPAVGQITVAQILLAVPEDNAAIHDHDKQLADSIYTALQGGTNFGDMAKQYSNDRRTYMNKGILPEFGVAKYDGEFEKEAFSLQHDGDISRPFQTTYGFHILKRISRSRIPENKADSFMSSLRGQVLADGRISVAKEKFLNTVLSRTGFKRNVSLNEKDFWRATDSMLLSNKNIYVGTSKEKVILFSFNNNARVTVADWLQYIKNVKTSSYASHPKESHDELMKTYISMAALENYRNRLEQFSPEFKYQLQEFREGDMFFEIMQRNVWAKAGTDSTGLQQYYNDHKENYKWNTSADAVLFSCSDITLAKTTAAEIKNKDWHDVVKANTQLQTDSGRYELTQIPSNGQADFKPGFITEPVVNGGDGTAVFALIIRTYPGDQQRNFNDARGLVINDYQNVLEKKWVDELRKRYPVKINENVLKSLNQ